MSTLITDLHLHSRYSRAVSPKMDLHEIAYWASRKGIDLVTTGDWTHPEWISHLTQELKEVTPGVFQLKNSSYPTRFILSTEISCIYRQAERSRRLHHLLFSPSLSSCYQFNQELSKRGANLQADGRPIISLSSRELLEIALSIKPALFLLPAHIWTPWFSTYGARSGFDSLQECFGELAPYIRSVETGLSSDPAMNWQVKELRDRTIVSFSDAHSGPKLGREATVLDSPTDIDQFSYADLLSALQGQKSGTKISYTIEYFPAEGKYHWSGHRACKIRYSPEDEKIHGLICPVCHKPLTRGVESRIHSLADHEITPQQLLYSTNEAEVTFVNQSKSPNPPFVSLVPLLEILQQVNQGSLTKAGRQYEEIIQNDLTEFDLLLSKTDSQLVRVVGERVAQAIMKVRKREIAVSPGYDGVFGKVSLNL